MTDTDHDDDSDEERQLSRDDLKTMAAEEIVAAKDAGELNHLLGREG